jgi:hypothetical protein
MATVDAATTKEYTSLQSTLCSMPAALASWKTMDVRRLLHMRGAADRDCTVASKAAQVFFED